MNKLMQLKPGSKQAKENHCMCEVGENGGYLINSQCPIHWNIHQTIILEKIHAFTLDQTKTQAKALWGLIAVCVVILFLQVIK